MPTAEFDATGAVTQRLTDDAFGRVTRNTNPGFQPFGYAGGLTDAATGLVRFGARDYDPTTGRWTAKDRLRFAGGSANMYSYVDADPVNYSDVNGLCRDKNGQPRACIVEWSTADQHNPNVDPRVLEAAQDIADIADVDLQLSSGLRVGDSGNHGRGLALDINAINGIDIGSKGYTRPEAIELARRVQDVARTLRSIRENYGPSGLWKASQSCSPERRYTTTKSLQKLQYDHMDHVHISVQPR